MARVHVERGRIINTPPEIVLCLWKNWDIFDAVLGNKWMIQKEREGVFSGKSQGIAAKIELMGSKVQKKSGEFRYLLTGRTLGTQLHTVVTLTYSETADSRTSVYGIFDVDAAGIFAFALRFLDKTIQKLADELIVDGDNACVSICECLDDVKTRLSSKQIEILEGYLPSKFRKKFIDKQMISDNEPLRLGIRNIGIFENFFHYLFEVELGQFSLSSKCLVDPKQRDKILNAVDKISDFVMFARGHDTKGDFRNINQDFYRKMNATFKALGEHLFFYFIPDAIRPHLLDLAPSVNLVFETTDADIPWELTYFSDSFLCMKHAIGRKPILEGIPRARKWRIRANKKSTHQRVLVLANPTGDLPESEREAEEIVERLKEFRTDIEIDFYKRSEVSKQRVVDCLHSALYNVIHFAGHGKFHQDPRLSRLVLSDAPLLADEVLRILEGTPMVFANACSSARLSGKDKSANMFFMENIQGMASVFLTKGAQAYIGALWPVHDKHAASFSVEFYKGIFERKETVGEALLKARLQARKKEHDFSWASFVLYGDPRKRLVL